MKMGSFFIAISGFTFKISRFELPKIHIKISRGKNNFYNRSITILKKNLRCIISLVFLIKLGKIVIVKDENSP